MGGASRSDSCLVRKVRTLLAAIVATCGVAGCQVTALVNTHNARTGMPVRVRASEPFNLLAADSAGSTSLCHATILEGTVVTAGPTFLDIRPAGVIRPAADSTGVVRTCPRTEPLRVHPRRGMWIVSTRGESIHGILLVASLLAVAITIGTIGSIGSIGPISF